MTLRDQRRRTWTSRRSCARSASGSRRRSRASTRTTRSARSPSAGSTRCSTPTTSTPTLIEDFRASPSAGTSVRPRDRSTAAAAAAWARCWGASARVLRPVQKLFWNPNPMISALSRQSDLNSYYVHLLHNLAVEITRLEPRAADLKNRNLQLQGRRRAAGPAREDPRVDGWRARPDGRTAREPSRRTAAGPPAPGRALLRRCHRQRVPGHPGHLRAGGLRVGHLRGEGPPADGAPGAAALGVRGGLGPGNGVPLPFLDRQRCGPAHPCRPRPAGRDLPQHHPRPFLPRASIRTWPDSATTAAASSPCSPSGPSSALGDSEYNRRELEEAGFARTAVLPIVLDFEAYRRPPSPVVRRLYRDGRTNILFVGPHHPQQADRRPHPGLRLLPALPRPAEPAAARGRPPWPRALLRPAAGAGARRCALDEVVFTGHVDDDELLRLLPAADLFLCLSEHEGFCVPLQEAMHFGLPVVAYDAGAVRETLHGGGVLLRGQEARGGGRAGARASSRTPPCARRVMATQDPRHLRDPRTPTSARSSASASRPCSLAGPAPVRIDQWVPDPAPRGCHRRLRASDAGCLPRAGDTRPTSTRSSWTRTCGATAGAAPSGVRAGPTTW